jgi:diaminopimelate decarboxylase
MLHNFTTRDNKLHIGGINAEDLVREFGSPLYVYDGAIIRRQYRALRDVISYPDTRFFYACKANPNPELLQILRQEGCGLEAVSYNEVLAGLDVGFAPEDIIFTCSFIAKDELEAVIKAGVMVNIDSLSQLRWFGEIKPGGKVSLRINQGIGAGHHEHTITGGPDSKFGIDITQLDEAKRIAAEHNVRIVGLHQHIGSHILEPETFMLAIRTLLQTARQFDGLEFLDFGGGFGVAYKPEDKPLDLPKLGAMITAEVETFTKEYGHIQIRFEPGRFLVAESGVLLGTVTDIKETPHHTFIGLNTGFNHLIRPMMYNSYHQIVNASNTDGKKKKVWIVGNICESGDIFAKNRDLQEPKPGDTIAILGAGAYGYAMSFFYNGRKQPEEALVDNGTARLISER